MKLSIKKGFSFGLTSGIITTLGLMVGLHSGTHLKLAVLGGVLTIAIADAMSDALGIHVSEEAENQHSTREIWESTLATFITKFIFALTFVIPVLIFPLTTAVLISIIWGLLLLAIISYKIAKSQNTNPWRIISEHIVIAVLVIIATHFAGDLISTIFS